MLYSKIHAAVMMRLNPENTEEHNKPSGSQIRGTAMHQAIALAAYL